MTFLERKRKIKRKWKFSFGQKRKKAENDQIANFRRRKRKRILVGMLTDRDPLRFDNRSTSLDRVRCWIFFGTQPLTSQRCSSGSTLLLWSLICFRNVTYQLSFWEICTLFFWTLWSLHQSWHIPTSIHGIGGIRKGEFWQSTKRVWCRKAFVIKILY